jgi:predicted RNase H-like HicB family nuclease
VENGTVDAAACYITLLRSRTLERLMKNEFTAIVERDEEWFIAYSPEMPGANGQGRTQDEAVRSLAAAIELILEDRREDGLRGIPEDAVREVVSIG